MSTKEKLEERRECLLGVRRTYQLNVILFTQEKKLDPTKKKDTHKQEALPTGTKKGDAMHLPKGSKTKRLRGLVQVARLNLTVNAYSSKVLELLRWKLATMGTKEFRQLYPICMTDKDFAEREKKVPGYIDGIYLMDRTAIVRYERESIDDTTLPKKAAKRKPTAEELAEARGPRPRGYKAWCRSLASTSRSTHTALRCSSY